MLVARKVKLFRRAQFAGENFGLQQARAVRILLRELLELRFALVCGRAVGRVKLGEVFPGRGVSIA